MSLEPAKDVVSGVVDAFRGQPLCLAAVVLALAFGGIMYFALEREADRKSKTTDIVIERCFPLYKGEKL